MLTSRNIKDRLEKELETNVALQLKDVSYNKILRRIRTIINIKVDWHDRFRTRMNIVYIDRQDRLEKEITLPFSSRTVAIDVSHNKTNTHHYKYNARLA